MSAIEASAKESPKTPPFNKNTPTFAIFVEQIYMPHIMARKRSWRLDESIIRRHIMGAFGGHAIKDIKTLQIEQWLTDLKEKGFAPGTCNRILAACKSIFAMAEKTGHLAQGMSPARHARGFKNYQRRERYLSQSEIASLMAALDNNQRLEAKAIQLLLLTGARKNEVLKAKWENVNLEQQILTVPISKSGKPRFILLSTQAVQVLKELQKNSNCIWLFPARDHTKPLSDIYTHWNKIRISLGLKDVRIHDLRHTFASLLVNSGRSLYEAQKLLGHADPRTTMRYAHMSKGALLNAVEGICSMMNINRAQTGKRKIVNNENCQPLQKKGSKSNWLSVGYYTSSAI